MSNGESYIRRTGQPIVVNLECPTQVFRCSTRLCDGSVLKPGQVEISQNYFVVVIFGVVHQIFQLNKMTDRISYHKLMHTD